MRTIRKIIIHCSATPEGYPFTIADIQRWHRERGFKSIGYHYVIHLDGTIHTGRPEQQAGAHCKGHNADSIGICYIGGLDATNLQPLDTRTQPQRKALRQLVEQLRHRYPQARVYGHCYFSTKACPCFDVQTDL